MRTREFATNPLGIPTARPKDIRRQRIAHHIASHTFDLDQYEVYVRSYESDQVQAATNPRPSQEVTHIMRSRISKATKFGEMHINQEASLTMRLATMNILKEAISAAEIQIRNPYNVSLSDNEQLTNDLKLKKAQLRRLENRANVLREELDYSNDKLLGAHRQDPHVPVADERPRYEELA